MEDEKLFYVDEGFDQWDALNEIWIHLEKTVHNEWDAVLFYRSGHTFFYAPVVRDKDEISKESMQGMIDSMGEEIAALKDQIADLHEEPPDDAETCDACENKIKDGVDRIPCTTCDSLICESCWCELPDGVLACPICGDEIGRYEP